MKSISRNLHQIHGNLHGLAPKQAICSEVSSGSLWRQRPVPGWPVRAFSVLSQPHNEKPSPCDVTVAASDVFRHVGLHR